MSASSAPCQTATERPHERIDPQPGEDLPLLRQQQPRGASIFFRAFSVEWQVVQRQYDGIYAFKLSGTLPPLSASFVMTCLCSQTFIAAEPLSAPV
jgi:hypothetical protein